MTFSFFINNKIKTICFLIVFLLVCYFPVKGYNLRKINNMENLSGSTIYSFYQDRKGMMWIGTNRGADIYDGKQIITYKPENNDFFFTGSRIDKIEQTSDTLLWFQTYYGLHKINLKTAAIESFEMFNQIAFSDKDNRENIFLIQGNNYIYYTLKGHTQFERVFIPELKVSDIVDFFIDINNKLWIFRKEGNNLCYSIKTNEQGYIHFITEETYTHPKEILYCSNDDNHLLYFVDITQSLYEFNTSTQKVSFIYNLKNNPVDKDDVTSLLKFNDDYFIGFKAAGLSLLKKNAQEYIYEKIDIPVGINCLYKDNYQDMVWIGTAGGGVYTYSIEQYSIKSFRLNDFTLKIHQPVNALFVDKKNTLWLGSKGAGILRIVDFRPDKNPKEHQMDFITASGSHLPDNIILSFAESREGNLWIGSERGLCYFTINDNSLSCVKLMYEGKNVEYISDICEQDSVLWISTMKTGIIKAQLEWRNGKPVLSPIKRVYVKETDEFTTLYLENDSILWWMNREEGLFRLNTITWKQEHIRLEGNTINEINSIRKDLRNNYLIGTNFGFIKYSFGNYKVLNKSNGFPANTIYDILPDSYSDYWLSSDRGLIHYNTDTELFRMYDHPEGLSVLEFKERASYRNEKNGTLFFGGTNGFVTIQKNYFDEDRHYMPPLYFTTLTVRDKKYPVKKFLTQKGNKVFLELSHDRNFFSLSFTATDHLNGNNYSYYYKLHPGQREWISNGNSDIISFTNLYPGNYRLLVKYYNKVLSKESYIYKMDIKVLSPWYKSFPAYGAYIIFIITGIYFVIGTAIRHNKNKKANRLQKLQQQHKEEIYESKLRFFTNIAHEFCTPLTLIYGPCNRLMKEKNLSAAAIKYTSIIKQNAERLNSLIQDLIEFNRIESGYKKPKITPLNITFLANELTESFSDMIEFRKIELEKDISPFLIWNSDKDFIITILLNLLSNAFKYTENEKKVKVKIDIFEDHLYITISNTGKGIAEKDISTLFDRYHILQRFEHNDSSSWSRTGLGLAISYNLIGLLKGSIAVESCPNEWTHFRVKLPHLEPATSELTDNNIIISRNYIPKNANPLQIPTISLDESKPTLLVVDDEAEIRWFIFDIFNEEYNVLTASHPGEAMEILKEIHPHLIISDVIMPETDGFSFSRKVKSDEMTGHIPFILLSARRDVWKVKSRD